MNVVITQAFRAPQLTNAFQRALNAVPQIITGTSPSLATLADGDTLADAVTWGSYASTAGTIASPTTKQQSLGGGSWVTYVGTTAVSALDVWRVRETVADNAGTDPVPFNSITQLVPAIAPTPAISITNTYTAGDTVGDVTFSLTGDTSGAPALDNGTVSILVDGASQAANFALTASEVITAQFTWTHASGAGSVTSEGVTVAVAATAAITSITGGHLQITIEYEGTLTIAGGEETITLEAT